MRFDHLLVVGFGGPPRPEDVKPFLEMVTRGRGIPEDRLREVTRHYEITGGYSPYNEHTFRLVEKLKSHLRSVGLPLPVFVGMRNWHPFLKEVLGEIHRQRLTQGIGIVLAPHRSEASYERYLKSVEEAQPAGSAHRIHYHYVRAWHHHPLFVQAQTEQVRKIWDSFPPGDPAATQVIFTAHSIPVEMAQRCGYEEEIRTSSTLVAEELGVREWILAYQSRSGTPRQPWLGPDVLSAIRNLAGKGKRRVLFIPIGFLSDHTEVLYDLDIEARQEAEQNNLSYFRASTVMDHPKFVEMCAQLIEQVLPSQSTIEDNKRSLQRRR